MSPAVHSVDAGSKGFARGLATDLERAIATAGAGDLLHIDSSHPMLDAALMRWCKDEGHAVAEKAALPGGRVRYVIRIDGDAAAAEDSEGPSHHLWIYTSLHCNLACDYCCVRSSPRASPDLIELTRIEGFAAEAPSLGFRRIMLTGGEPFLRPDLDEVVRACTDELPTTLLTNGMLWQGPRRALLERMPRDRLTLQVSLDSPDAVLHDAHRGAGSWDRARTGIRLAKGLGFRVRVAATTHTRAQAQAMHAFLETEGVEPQDRLVRPVALRGEAKEGIPLLRGGLRPEITLRGRAAYWHPVGALDDDFLVSSDVASLADVVAKVRAMEEEDRASTDQLASTFHCT